MIHRALLLVTLFAASVTTAQESAPAPAPAPLSAHAQLLQVLAASDDANLQRNPILAIFRGDPRFADRFGDYLTDAYYAAERRAAQDDLAALPMRVLESVIDDWIAAKKHG